MKQKMDQSLDELLKQMINIKNNRGILENYYNLIYKLIFYFWFIIMVELFQYYGNDFKYFYLNNIPKKDIASKAMIFSCRYRKHRVKLLNMKKKKILVTI